MMDREGRDGKERPQSSPGAVGMTGKNDFRNRKALVLAPGSIEDLGDVVKVARAEGRKVLSAERVRVLPHLSCDPDGNYIVIVEPESPPDGVVGESAAEADAQGEDGAPRRTGRRRSRAEAKSR